jgi:transposase-like protein
MKRITKEVREKIYEAYLNGIKTSRICREFNISTTTLYNIRDEFKLV